MPYDHMKEQEAREERSISHFGSFTQQAEIVVRDGVIGIRIGISPNIRLQEPGLRPSIPGEGEPQATE